VVSTPKQPDDDPKSNTLNKQTQENKEQFHSIHAETNQQQQWKYNQRDYSNTNIRSSSIVCISSNSIFISGYCSRINSAIRGSISCSLFVDGVRGVRGGIELVQSSSGSRLSFHDSVNRNPILVLSFLFSPFEMVCSTISIKYSWQLALVVASEVLGLEQSRAYQFLFFRLVVVFECLGSVMCPRSHSVILICVHMYLYFQCL